MPWKTSSSYAHSVMATDVPLPDQYLPGRFHRSGSHVRGMVEPDQPGTMVAHYTAVGSRTHEKVTPHSTGALK